MNVFRFPKNNPKNKGFLGQAAVLWRHFLMRIHQNTDRLVVIAVLVGTAH